MTRKPGRRRALAACLLILAAAGPPEPPDYRMAHYNAPTPETLRGATVLTTQAARALWQSGTAAFIDVLPQAPKPPDLPPGTLWQVPPHDDIPGSLWLVDTGYGALPAAMQDYFARGLSRASGGDPAKPLVFYCKPDCWMSWNAARRALSLGYTHVAWYPEGVVAWQAAGLPVERREPLPRPPQ